MQNALSRLSYVNEQVSQHQVIDICSNPHPQGVLIQDLENEHICIIYEQGSQNFLLLFITMQMS